MGQKSTLYFLKNSWCSMNVLQFGNYTSYHGMHPLKMPLSQYLPFKRQSHKMVKHTQTIRRVLPVNCLSVFDHLVGLAFKGLRTATLICFKWFDMHYGVNQAHQNSALLHFEHVDLTQYFSVFQELHMLLHFQYCMQN